MPDKNSKVQETVIHPTAVVDPAAEVGQGISIGPYAVIGPDVRIGSGVQVGPHAVIEGHTTIAPGVRISQFAAVGGPPQDLKYKGEPTELVISERTVIREFVTLHRGTVGGGGVTRIGSDCLIMAYCHVAHDCQVGNNVIMANGATLGGHVVVEDDVIIGGLSAIHQFCRVGRLTFLGGMSGANKDIPPYVRYWGQRGKIYGLNLVGLRRHGCSRDAIAALRRAYHLIFVEARTVSQGLDKVETELGNVPEVAHLVEFVRSSKRGIPLYSEGDED